MAAEVQRWRGVFVWQVRSGPSVGHTTWSIAVPLEARALVIVHAVHSSGCVPTLHNGVTMTSMQCDCLYFCLLMMAQMQVTSDAGLSYDEQARTRPRRCPRQAHLKVSVSRLSLQPSHAASLIQTGCITVQQHTHTRPSPQHNERKQDGT